MSMFTDSALTASDREHARALHAAFLLNVARAGEDHSWSGHSFSKPSGDALLGLRVWLIEQQRGLCAACGEELRIDDAHLAHLVSNSGTPGKRGGFVAGNVVMSHGTTCNAIVDKAVAARLGGVDVHPLTLAGWQNVPLVWPTTGDLRQIGAEHRASNDTHGALDAHVADRIGQMESILAELGL